VLVAGIGNVFLGDDGFGVEVAARLSAVELPTGVDVGDFGIAGLHLAYQMCDGYDAAVLVDAAPRGGRPGDLYVIEPDPGPGPAGVGAGIGPGIGGPDVGGSVGPGIDAHGMTPEAVLQMVGVLGGRLDRVLVVGCEPTRIAEGMGLSPAVASRVDAAVALVTGVVNQLVGATAPPGPDGGVRDAQEDPGPRRTDRPRSRRGLQRRRPQALHQDPADVGAPVHEIGLCEGILDAVERRAAGRRVLGVRVRAGADLRVVEPALDQAFALVAAGSIADGARVDLVSVAGDELTLESIEVAKEAGEPCA
jgi:hydrogenase maturation protease